MPKEEREFWPVDLMPWTRVEQVKKGKAVDGIYEKILSHDPETGDHTRLLWFLPGVDTTPMGSPSHDYWEEVYVIEGSVVDLRLNEIFTKGMYACRPPHMEHGPWRTDTGYIALEIRYYK